MNDAILNRFMSLRQEIQPAGVLNIIAGFSAAVMIHAEFNGIPALIITAIIDSHFVTPETLKAFKVVASELLDMKTFKFDEIANLPGFKAALKEVNQRENSIFT